MVCVFFFFSSRRRHTRCSRDWSSDVCSSDLENHTGDPTLDNVGHMAADWVTQGLAQTGLVEVVPSVSVMSSSRTPGGHGPGHLVCRLLLEKKNQTGADTVVSGAYYLQAGSNRCPGRMSRLKD